MPESERAALAAPYDIEAVRKDFPILSREVYGKPLVYLDNGASAQKPQVVIDAVSQTTGAERTVSVEAVAAGLLLAISEEGTELARVEVPPDRLLAVLTDRPQAPQQVVAFDAKVL